MWDGAVWVYNRCMFEWCAEKHVVQAHFELNMRGREMDCKLWIKKGAPREDSVIILIKREI